MKERGGLVLLALSFALGSSSDARASGLFVQQRELAGSDSGAEFGFAVSVDGNTAVIGAPNAGAAGQAMILARSGTGWSQQALLTASDAVGGDNFGAAVALSGDTVVIGAPFKGGQTGAAYVFVRGGSAWSQQAKLTAGDASAARQGRPGCASHVRARGRVLPRARAGACGRRGTRRGGIRTPSPLGVKAKPLALRMAPWSTSSTRSRANSLIKRHPTAGLAVVSLSGDAPGPFRGRRGRTAPMQRRLRSRAHQARDALSQGGNAPSSLRGRFLVLVQQ